MIRKIGSDVAAQHGTGWLFETRDVEQHLSNYIRGEYSKWPLYMKLMNGDRIEVVQDNECGSEGRTQIDLHAGMKGTIDSICGDDAIVKFDDLEQPYLYMAHFHHLKRIPQVFTVGDTILVDANIMSNNQNPVLLEAGKQGRISRINENGSIFVKFAHSDRRQWIKPFNFKYIRIEVDSVSETWRRFNDLLTVRPLNNIESAGALLRRVNYTPPLKEKKESKRTKRRARCL